MSGIWIHEAVIELVQTLGYVGLLFALLIIAGYILYWKLGK